MDEQSNEHMPEPNIRRSHTTNYRSAAAAYITRRWLDILYEQVLLVVVIMAIALILWHVWRFVGGYVDTYPISIENILWRLPIAPSNNAISPPAPEVYTDGVPLLVRVYQSLPAGLMLWFFVAILHFATRVDKVNDLSNKMVKSGLSPRDFFRLDEFEQVWNWVVERTSSVSVLEPDSAEAALTALEYTDAFIINRDPQACTDCAFVYRFASAEIFNEFELPAELPLVLFHPNGRVDERWLIDSLTSVVTSGRARFAIAIVLGTQDRSSWGSLTQSLRLTFAYDLVIISEVHLRGLLLSATPRRDFRRLVLHQINLLTVSPFNIAGPTRGSMFFGREFELRTLSEGVGLSNYAIIGGRRIGKTSLLLNLHQFRLPARGVVSIYHDCSGSSSHQLFLKTRIRSWRPEAPRNAPETFGELFARVDLPFPLVVLLDEADKILPSEHDSGWPLFSMLRGIASTGTATFVFSGESSLMQAIRDARSPLFNFASTLYLGPLDRSSAEDLVRRSMARLEMIIEDESEFMAVLFRLTSGHPNIIQRICQRLIIMKNYRRDSLTINTRDLMVVAGDPDFQREDLLGTLLEAASPLEKIISLLMASDKSLTSVASIRNALEFHCGISPSAKNVHLALQSLVHLRSILHQTSEGYFFAVESFPEVVAGSVTSADMVEVLVDEYSLKPLT